MVRGSKKKASTEGRGGIRWNQNIERKAGEGEREKGREGERRDAVGNGRETIEIVWRKRDRNMKRGWI